MSLAYRKATSEDLRFVIGSWTDSYRNAHMAGMIPMPMWSEVFPGFIAWMLRRPGVVVWVAYKPGETTADIYGWVAVETGITLPSRSRKNGHWQRENKPSDMPLVHYVFVKQAYRKLGMARRLLKHAGARMDEPFVYSCKTGVVSKLPIPHAQWMPLVARYPKTKPQEQENVRSDRSRADLLCGLNGTNPRGAKPLEHQKKH